MEINRNTYEEFFLLYVDGELNESDRKVVEDFAGKHPDLQEELDILKASVLTPDSDVMYENKDELFREEKERRVIAFRWWRIAAAAVVVLALGTFGWKYLVNGPAEQPATVARVNDTVNGNVNDITKKTPVPGNNETPEMPEPVIEKLPLKEKTRTTDPEAQDFRRNIARNIQKAPVEKTVPEKIDNVREPLNNSVATAKIKEPAEEIAVDVEPRKLDKEQVHPLMAAAFTQTEPTIDQSEDDDMIYFANTSVSKRNKFRGVFRKATRILDRVTSLQ